MKIFIAVVMMMLGFSSCAGVRDIPKSIWGSSTRVLEEQRANALVKVYDKGYWDCFRAADKFLTKKKYVMFKNDEVRGYMVIMGVPGAVNTTEVGVFFVEVNDQQTRIELSSLSTHAKRLLGKSLFHGMDVAFGLAAADKEDGFDESEFKHGMTPEALIKAIDNDGFSIPSADSAVESLNALLKDEFFYEHWLNKYRSVVLPKETMDIINIKAQSRSSAQVRDLNRSLLEETYPTVCPKIKSSTEKTIESKTT